MSTLAVVVRGENLALVEKLKVKGLSAYLVKDGTQIFIPSSGLIFSDAINLDGAEFRVNAVEEGGALTKRGYGIVVCGANGEALKPYNTSCQSTGSHAFFSIKNVLVTITAQRRSRVVWIEEYEAVLEGRLAKLQKNDLWYGYPEELPNSLGCFKEAVEAATKKANCYHCRHVHFSGESLGGEKRRRETEAMPEIPDDIVSLPPTPPKQEPEIDPDAPLISRRKRSAPAPESPTY